jgi:hypothetical protein
MDVDSLNQTAAQSQLPEQPAGNADAAGALGDLAVDSANYIRAWSRLFADETRLAGSSMVRLAFGMLVVPALALVICAALDALLASILQRWLHDWASDIAIVLGIDIVCLFALLVSIRRWWRNLSLPRSRAALVHLFERIA